MTPVEEVRVEDAPSCLLCGKQGAKLHEGLPDRMFGAPGKWGFLRCPQCGLVWLNPRPVPEEIGKVYGTYYTHSDADRRSRLALFKEKIDLALLAALPGYEALAPGIGWRELGRVLSLFPPIREGAKLGARYLDGVNKGRLLDVGCGNGRFLSIMRDAGWEVLGVEPDPVSAKSSKELLGIPTIVGTLWDAKLPDKSFEAVTLSHVIEHVYDPIALLRECQRVLKPEGRLVVVTPNVDSMGHQAFREYWRGLEPPRHLHLFSIPTLRMCAEKSGLQTKALRSSPRMARSCWAQSHIMKSKGRFSLSDAKWRLRIRGLAFRVREQAALRASEVAGEELILIGLPRP